MTDPITHGLLPEGLRDRLPPEAEAAAALLHGLLATMAAHGYRRVQPPLAEFENSLAGRLGGGRATNLFRVSDPVSGATLALRHDITGQVGRIAATRLADATRPLRLSYGGPVLRMRGDQLNPAREMLQAGAELTGRDSVAAAAEVLTVAVVALGAAGVTGLAIDLTLPDIVDTLASQVLPAARLAELKHLLDMKDAGGLTAAGLADWLPLLAATGPVEAALDQLRRFDHAGLLASRIAGVAELAVALGGAARVTLDPTERHGFEYQTWIGFSLFADSVAGEIGRGGSYAVTHPDGHAEPAVGLSLYVDSLVDAGLGRSEARRVFLPAGTPAEVGRRLRAAGDVAVAGLATGDAPAHCSHVWDGEAVVPL